MGDVRRQFESERAFTLIELLVVMIIISILMAVAVPTFMSQKSSAMRTRALSNIKAVINAVETCAIDHQGDYGVCTQHALLVTYEPSLKQNLDVWSGQARAPFEMDVDAIQDGKVIKAPSASQTYQGFIVATWVQDGDHKIWFSEAHMEDGALIKACGEGMTDAAAPSNAAPTQGSTVAGSRICTNGRWG